MSTRWHILRDGDTVTLTRHLPPRFDFAVRTTLGPGHAVRLAHQIRQDLWRACQDVRGFSPVVRLELDGAGWAVTAGGRTLGPVPQRTLDAIHNLLENPGNRARWGRYARSTAPA